MPPLSSQIAGAGHNAWPAPLAIAPLHARVELPGSKSLSARYLILAALAQLGDKQGCAGADAISGLLESRDTDLMRAALARLGFSGFLSDDAAHDPAWDHVVIECGLAGTVMRFIAALAAARPLLPGKAQVIELRGDAEAARRPMAGLYDALKQLGASIELPGGPDTALPAIIRPASAEHFSATTPARVTVDSAASSQFLSALLLIGSALPSGLEIDVVGTIPSQPHIDMTLATIAHAGGHVEVARDGRSYRIHPRHLDLGQVSVEPDLSNAGPFLAAALACGGQVSIPHWPAHTTQAGDAWREILTDFGATIDFHPQDANATLTARATPGDLRGIDRDFTAYGELVPTAAALATLAAARGHGSRLYGIGHLRGHETDRLAALAAEITRLGGRAIEQADALIIEPGALGASAQNPVVCRAYADHRMATFAAIIGLAIPGIYIDDIACTSKTMPDFPRLWQTMIGEHS